MASNSINCSIERIFAIADIHVDHMDNQNAIKSWSSQQYGRDALLVAGDVTSSMSLLSNTLQFLSDVFSVVFYVPGNHDLWLEQNGLVKDSLRKFYKLIALCESLGVRTQPTKLTIDNTSGGESVWVVPLFSWYTTPDEDRSDSLYITHPSVKEDLDKVNLLWMDNHNCVWPSMFDSYPAAYFCDMNDDAIDSCQLDSSSIVSFSHFLPRSDLLIPDDRETKSLRSERLKRGLCPAIPANQGAPEFFNFSRFAGCKRLDRQIRQIGSAVHFYGHQHRNRDRTIDNVRYISHSLGYKKERDNGLIWGLNKNLEPKQIWPLPSALDVS